MTKSIEASMHDEAPQRVPLVNREDYLIGLASEARHVAHLGCTDWPFTQERIESGELLHARLVKVSDCDGFDIDKEGIAVLEGQLPGRYFSQDISQEIQPECEGAYDLVIAGEVLEHVPNPGNFLQACRRLLTPDGKLCLTVPNAVAPKNGLRALAAQEVVHPDHYTYYSPRTLSRTFVGAGFAKPDLATSFASADPLGQVLNRMLRVTHRFRPGPVGDSIIGTALIADN